MPNPASRRVVALAYDGLCAFELGITVEVFGLPRQELKVPWYRFQVCSLERGPLRATGGVKVEAEAGIEALRHAGTVVIPGWRDAEERPPEAMLEAVRAAYEQGSRLVTICSGVFVLAAAGLLDGRRATTHWRHVELLQSLYPAILVEPDVLYVEDGNLWTSAGSAAGIDLCLHLVRCDYGAAIANQVARRLVVAPHRDGGQAQFVATPVRTEVSDGLAPVLAWARERLDQPLTVPDLARQAVMSPRNFARRFREETGTTPHRWLNHQRLLEAEHLLETTDLSMDSVAEAVGWSSAATLRFHVRRSLRTAPTSYRRRFRARSS